MFLGPEDKQTVGYRISESGCRTVFESELKISDSVFLYLQYLGIVYMMSYGKKTDVCEFQDCMLDYLKNHSAFRAVQGQLLSKRILYLTLRTVGGIFAWKWNFDWN